MASKDDLKSASAASQPPFIDTEWYSTQVALWPKEGKHILAQYDDNSIIMYQAYKPCIAEYAVENQRFGGPAFSFERMSWIKTNFLWMMYRCGWASKKDQERVLAVRITRAGFEEILANAFTAKFLKVIKNTPGHILQLQKHEGLETDEITVRLQWDPDHSPTYEKLPRRAVQLGLKGEILKKYGTEWIVSIADITDFVKEQKRILDEKGPEEIKTPKERVYTVTDSSIGARIELDSIKKQEEANTVGFS